jgi:spore maturation protein SpmB
MEVGKIEVKWYGYVALILALVLFSGVFSTRTDWVKVFDFSNLLGSFGKIPGGDGKSYDFRGTGGASVRDGFVFAIQLIPVVMTALGLIAVFDYFGALLAGQRLLTPLLKPLLGIPGYCSLAMLGSLQSTDAGAAMTKQLYDAGLINDKERDIFATFQFSADGTITNFFSTGALAFPALIAAGVSPVTVLAVIFAMKFFGANIFRLYLKFRGGKSEERREQTRVQTQASVQAGKATLYTGEIKGTKIYEAFIDGMRRGWDIGVKYILPNVMMAFLIIYILDITGVLNLIGVALGPIMGLWGLPGAAIMVLIASFMSMGGGMGVALSLYKAGVLTNAHMAILTPAILLMGALIQYQGRALTVIGTPPKYWGHMFVITIVNALVAMAIMRMILLFMGVM